MENILIKIPEEYKSLFRNKDIVSIAYLMETIDELQYEIKELKEELEDKKEQYDNTDDLRDDMMIERGV